MPLEPGQPRVRGSIVFEKPPLSLSDLVDRVENRGLVVPERARAERYVRHIGYFRFSPYAIPFREERSMEELREGTEFDDLLDLYVFDRALRLLVIDALERVEVAVRAALTDHMATTYDDPHWYVDSSHFRGRASHNKFVGMVRKTCKDRLDDSPERDVDRLVHRSALEHYLLTYGEPELPPSWLMVETLTLGQLSRLYGNIRDKRDRDAIARTLGLTAPLLESWLLTYVRVRNICAHHGRLWNVGLGVYPMIPTNRRISWLAGAGALADGSRMRLYPVLVSLQTVLSTVSPRSSWASRLHGLLSPRPPMNLAGMGVPLDWAEDEFWLQPITAPSA